MKRQLGSTAGLLALLALVFHTQSNTAPEGGASRGTGAESKSSKGKSEAAASLTTPEPPEGPWIATQAFFNVPSHRLYEPSDGAIPPQVIALQAALFDRKGSPDAQELKKLLGLPEGFEGQYHSWSIVATVADPRHTRLSLFLDRQLEAIQKSFGKAGWEFAAQWLPWMDPANPDEGGIGERTREKWVQHRQEEFPGIVVFRRSPPTRSDKFPPEVAFVLLVPETPTSGINGESFLAAMHLAHVLSTEPNEIGLLAPTFSGSFFSLSNLVQAWNKRSPPRDRRVHRVVYGGSISNQDYAASFQESTGFDFHGGIANAQRYSESFECVLKRYHINRGQAAYLVEGVTGFSRAFREKPQAKDPKETQKKQTKRKETKEQETPTKEAQPPIPRYVVPRDIDHMRNAYKEATGGAGGGRGAQPSASVDFSLKDPNGGEDSFPMFSDRQMPLSQDAAMRLITQDLKRVGTRIVMIATTNVLDSIFLARLVRRDSPDTRVLIADPDILFVTAAAQDPLAGTLFLSTYPMFLKGDEWFKYDDPEHLMFPGPDFQGIFNVTQLLLKEIKAVESPALLGYGQLGKSGDELRPGLWLLTLTRTGFLPLDLFENRDPQWFNPNTPDKSDQLHLADWPPPFAWKLTAFFSSLAILSGCFYLLVCNRFFSGTEPVWLRLATEPPLLVPRSLALLAACLSLSSLEWVLGFPVWCATGLYAGTGLLLGLLTFVGFIAPIASLVWILKRGKVLPREALQESLLHSVAYGGIAIVLFLVVAGAWSYACFFQGPPAALFFRLRAVDLMSGSSPATPLAILSLVFLFFSLSYFMRYTATTSGPANLSLTILGQDIESEQSDIKRFILAPVPLEPRHWWWRMSVSSVFVIASLATLGRSVGAFETRAYNLALGFAMAVVLLCLATGCYDLTFLWRHFKRLLDGLEPVPVSRGRPRAIWAVGPAPVTLKDYIEYVRDQIRGIALHIAVGFVMLSVFLNSYNPQGPMGLARFLAVLLVGIGLVVVPVLAGMERNPVLSKISQTKPGELNRDFWVRLVALGGLPLLGVLAHLFPSISTFLFSWVAPSMEALH